MKRNSIRIVVVLFAVSSQLTAASFYVGQKVKIKFEKDYYKATVLKVKPDSCFISYDGYDSKWNQWVDNSYIVPQQSTSSSSAANQFPLKMTRVVTGPDGSKYKVIIRWKINTDLSTDDYLKQLESKYSIKIKYRIDSSFFPADWKLKPVNASATVVDGSELERLPKLLAQALKRYPDAVIKKNLKEICISKVLNFYGDDYSGTNYYNRVYLVNNGKANGYTDAFILGTFHNEFSKVLLENFKFPKAVWIECNGKGFKYGNSDSTSTTGSEKYYAKGFLHGYGMTSFEEDFGSYSEAMFLQPAKMRRLIKKYPIIQMKAWLWLAFYVKVHPELTDKNILQQR